MSEWISVKDRLPEDGQQVLVVKHGRSYRGAGDRVAKAYLGTFGTDNETYFFVTPHRYWQHEWRHFGLTHWMAVPALPTSLD